MVIYKKLYEPNNILKNKKEICKDINKKWGKYTHSFNDCKKYLGLIIIEERAIRHPKINKMGEI